MMTPLSLLPLLLLFCSLLSECSMEVLFIVEPLFALTAPPQSEMNNLIQQQIKLVHTAPTNFLPAKKFDRSLRLRSNFWHD